MSRPGRKPWRLLCDRGGDGAWQMATDEILLEGMARGVSPPTLRLYVFDPPALSLGRHQPVSGAADVSWCRGQGIDLVRRPTGGGAVLHERDTLTYALAAPLDDRGIGCSVSEVSLRLGRTLRDALAGLGIAVRLVGRRAGVHPAEQGACFARPSRHEIVARGRKLAGSAQVRRRRGVLQHGSLPLTVDHSRHRRATASPLSLPLISLSEAAGRPVARDEAEEALIRAFARLAPRGLEVGYLDAAEREAIQRLRTGRYRDDRWTFSRSAPARRSA